MKLDGVMRQMSEILLLLCIHNKCKYFKCSKYFFRSGVINLQLIKNLSAYLTKKLKLTRDSKHSFNEFRYRELFTGRVNSPYFIIN